MTWRSVWSRKPRAASVPSPATCGLAPQLVIQPSAPERAAAGREAAMMDRLTAATTTATAPGSPRRISRAAFRRRAGLMVSPHSDSPAIGETPLSAVGLHQELCHFSRAGKRNGQSSPSHSPEGPATAGGRSGSPAAGSDMLGGMMRSLGAVRPWLASTEVVYGVTGTDVTVLPEYGVLP